jgi:hypothetical protein
VAFSVVSGAPDRSGLTADRGGSVFRLGDMGEMSVERNGEFLLWNGGLAALTEDGEMSCQELCFRAKSYSASAEGAKINGSLLVPGGGTVGVSMSVTPLDDRFRVTCSLDGVPEGVASFGFAFLVSPGYLSEGATLTGDQGARAIHSETDEVGVRKLILGGTGKRLSIVSEAPARLMVAGGRSLRLALLLPAKDGEVSFEIVTDFAKERQNARSILTQARQAKAAGRLGEAMVLYARVVNEFPFDDGTRQQAKNELAEIAEGAKARKDRAEALFRDSQAFFDVDDLTLALAEATSLQADFAGFELFDEAATDLVTKIRARLTEIETERSEVAVGRLLEQAKDCEARGDERLAEAFRQAAERLKGK